MRRTGLLLALALVPTLAGFFACQRAEEPVAGPAELPPEPEIRVAGSETLYPVLERLVQAYAEENPRARVRILPGTSTAGAAVGVRSGAVDLGTCSRRLRPEELEGLAYHLLGYDPIAFAAHPSCGVPRLEPDHIRRIYAGEIRNWNELDGVDHDILVLDREPGESLRRVLLDAFFGPSFRMTRDAVVLPHASDMRRALASTPYAIGYAGRAELRASGIEVRVVPPAGVWPRAQDARSGAFPLVIPLGIVSPTEPRPEVTRFLGFLVGPRAAAVLDALGAVAAAPSR
ncbi:substrate-binding domain-containing protein [Deferrisoma sp.]